MIDVNKITEKVKRFFDREGVPPIVQADDTYHVLGKYRIVVKDGRYDLYKHEHYVDVLSSSAAALSWCMYDSKNQWQQTHAILTNDRKVQQYRFEIENRKRILKETRDQEEKQWLTIRINEDAHRLREAKRNLEKYVRMAKYIKIKGFNDESK
jgi:hypothetical protein